jgi:hypothetical protein
VSSVVTLSRSSHCPSARRPASTSHAPKTRAQPAGSFLLGRRRRLAESGRVESADVLR